MSSRERPKFIETQAPTSSNENINIHVAITTSNDSDLSQVELDSIQTKIEEMYVDSYIDRHDNYPIFVGKPEITTSVLKLVCKNEFTLEWLQRKIRDMKTNRGTEKLPLKLVMQKDLPTKVKCQFKLSKNIISPIKLQSTLKHMDRNNVFGVDKWTFHNITETDSGGLYVEVGIPSELLPIIMKKGPLMIGFDPVELNVINEKEDSNQATAPNSVQDAEPSVEAPIMDNKSSKHHERQNAPKGEDPDNTMSSRNKPNVVETQAPKSSKENRNIHEAITTSNDSDLSQVELDSIQTKMQKGPLIIGLDPVEQNVINEKEYSKQATVPNTVQDARPSVEVPIIDNKSSKHHERQNAPKGEDPDNTMSSRNKPNVVETQAPKSSKENRNIHEAITTSNDSDLSQVELDSIQTKMQKGPLIIGLDPVEQNVINEKEYSKQATVPNTVQDARPSVEAPIIDNKSSKHHERQNAPKGEDPDNTMSSRNKPNVVEKQAPKSSNENSNIHVAITTSNNSDLSQVELDSIQTKMQKGPLMIDLDPVEQNVINEKEDSKQATVPNTVQDARPSVEAWIKDNNSSKHHKRQNAPKGANPDNTMSSRNKLKLVETQALKSSNENINIHEAITTSNDLDLSQVELDSIQTKMQKGPLMNSLDDPVELNVINETEDSKQATIQDAGPSDEDFCRLLKSKTSCPECRMKKIQLSESDTGTIVPIDTEQDLVLAIESKVERSSISCENDSDLESIPSVSLFKKLTWNVGKSKKVSQSNLNEKNGTRMSFGENGNIEGQWKNNHLIELDSCHFTHPYSNKTVYIRKQSPGYLFTFDQENFIARVSIHKIEELDFAKHSIDIKRNFLKKLKITKIIEDELLNDRAKAYEQFKQLLQDKIGKTAYNLENAEDLFQFSKILEDCTKFSSSIMILDDIVKNKNISCETNSFIQQLLDRERALDVRNKEFSDVAQFYTIDLLTELHKICKGGIDNHRNTIYDKYFYTFSLLPDHLSRLNDKSILYVSNKDVELFADLIDIMDKQPFLDFISNSWDIFFKHVEKIRQHESIGNFAPLTNPVYFYLCKSFKELISEISILTDISINDLLHKDKHGKFSLMDIHWLSASPLNLSLGQQYRFVFELMEHFNPGYYSNKSNFKYEFKLLQNFGDKTLWQSIKNKKLSAIPQERLIWIYILDNAIANLFSKKELNLFEPLLTGYTNFIIVTKGDHYESFRIVTHNTARFIIQTKPYLSQGVSKIDQDILTKQIKSIKEAFVDGQSNDFRDLVDVYNEYWKNRQTILEKIPDKFPYGKFRGNMEKIYQTLLDITSTALDKKTKSQGFIKYFRSFNEFLEDFNDIDFTWFIKKDDINDHFTEVELVNADKNSYKVLNPENFIEKCQKIPNHYFIEISQDLLNCISLLLRQNKWSDDDNFNAASEMISAIKKSLIYLKDQPNYVSFNTFKEESTKPFFSVLHNSISYEDFKKRIDIIGGSFWYLRKQDEIDIDKALALYSKENCNDTNEILRNCYSSYLKIFESYIQKTSDKNYQDKIEYIIGKVKKQSEQIKIYKWSLQFKRETLPELLAGLAAVWSIQESKDIASTGKSLKPHCIQILCILRLLSVDKNSKGVDKHLAQVLTGQGKSLVLGLLSSLLALTGHEVSTVCYSEYLATRDQQDFDGFFKQFGIDGKITYGTFDAMVNKVLKPEVNGKKQGLRELVKDLILNHSAETSGQIKREDISNTTLLIDEVDVFFSDQFYGNTYGACTTIEIPGLAIIQEKIYEMAKKHFEKNTILKELEEFTNKKIAERNQSFKEFNNFLSKPGKYYLLSKEDDVVIKKEYTNRSLYQEHLEEMVVAAVYVVKGSDKDWYINSYKIDDNGIISYRKSDGIYSIFTFSDYYNVFSYFRLKKKEFDIKDYKNYGYLNISCGKVSYAKLPKKYPLILGVSGTLTTLNDHEKKVVRESYNIRENSIMPSFFGYSHLKFSPSKNFTSQNSEEQWLSTIYSHANSKISTGKSVLIFFDTDIEINKFKEKFLGKFDRLHILTENTEKLRKEKYVDEAGVTKTITLATRGMGRGVDFKSSVAVEKSGGVHVIQTFFSLDIKEETQIKGRTARQGNKGSYELILCRDHLINAGFLGDIEAPVDYQSLHTTRYLKIEEKGSNDEERIKKSENDHKTTMDYLESFFQKE